MLISCTTCSCAGHGSRRSSLGQAAISASSINYAVMQLPWRIPATTVMTAPGIYTDRASSKHKLSPICQLFMRLPKCRDLRNFRLENCFQLAGGRHGANLVTMTIHWRPCGYGGYLVLVAGAGAALLAVRQLRRGDHVWSLHRVRRPLQLRRGHRRDVYFLSLFAGAKMSRLRHFFCRGFVQLRWPAQWRW